MVEIENLKNKINQNEEMIKGYEKQINKEKFIVKILKKIETICKK